jgi:glycosidase
VLKENRRIYQIGETYGTSELISSYVNSGMLDAQFDFNLYDAISTALAVGNSFKNVENTMNNSLKYYGNHNIMGNITGNQDRGRFISYAGGALKFDEDAKVAGWTRKVEIGDKTAYNKSAMLMAFINTVPGIPVIYYGDEIGMYGGNDPDNRKMMKFSNLSPEESTLKNQTAELCKLRRSSLPLIYGDLKFLTVSDEVMVYQRSYFGKFVIVVFNNSKEEKNITFKIDSYFDLSKMKTLYDSEYAISDKEVSVKMSSISFELFIN